MYKAVLWQGSLSIECCLIVFNMETMAVSLTVWQIGFPGAVGWGLGSSCFEQTIHGQDLGFIGCIVTGLYF